MLDLKYVAQNFEAVKERLKLRGGNLDLGRFQALVEERRELYIALESLNQTRNSANEEIKLKAKQDPGAIERLRDQMRSLSSTIREKESQLKAVEEELEKILLLVPNLPDPSVPVGASAEDNRVERTWGEKPSFAFPPKQHFELGERLGALDFERAAKVSGSRFAFYRGPLARLERALISFMLDVHTSRGYTELLPPYLVNRAAMMGTGQLPKFEDDAFKTAGSQELFLIPTAEVPLTNYHQNEILEGDRLPLKYCAFSPCFRAEAGSAGKDTRGLVRQHQFHKVELVKFSTPENSSAELEGLTADAEEILRRLNLPYRVMTLCTADLGFSAAKTYDLEVWLPGQNAYREISSCSNCGDFQARRAQIRFRRAKGDKPQLCHTLNGSGLAVGRTLIAILENNQGADGSIDIPEALVGYMGGLNRIGPP
ncbi:MAG TPA: serine--tRNA ligase [Myxococcaceae bacterium]|nr:serine--tRNA ligase [Myxococcaceae bacterium]